MMPMHNEEAQGPCKPHHGDRPEQAYSGYDGGTGSTSLPSRRRAEAMTGLMFAEFRAEHV